MVNRLKIGIITISKVNNYGADLQAYALQRKLINLSFDAEIIDYLHYKHKDFKHTRNSLPFINIGFKRRLKETVAHFWRKFRSLYASEETSARNTKFVNFYTKHMQYSSNTYKSFDELYEATLNYDVFIVGSDQVWNPYSNVSLKPYFLTFAPENKHKISYASSFGVSTLPYAAQDRYRQCLNNLDRISVREADGVKLVEQLTGRNATHVLDPTLLLEKKEWETIASTSSNTRPYLLLYVLTDSHYCTDLAKRVASDLGIDVVRICKNAAKQDKDKSIVNITDAGPAEFVGLFIHASFVVTNSFHGTAFSVNFEKPFYTVLPGHKPNNSRQQGLLFSLNLSNRLIKEGTEFPQKESYNLDFTESGRLLDAKRIHSVNWLVSAIGERPRV